MRAGDMARQVMAFAGDILWKDSRCFRVLTELRGDHCTVEAHFFVHGTEASFSHSFSMVELANFAGPLEMVATLPLSKRLSELGDQ